MAFWIAAARWQLALLALAVSVARLGASANTEEADASFDGARACPNALECDEHRASESLQLLQADSKKVVRIDHRGEERFVDEDERLGDLSEAEAEDDDPERPSGAPPPSDQPAGGQAPLSSAPSPSPAAAEPRAPNTTKVGINLSVKWMAKPLQAAQAVEAIPRIQEVLGLSRPIQRVKTFDLSRTNVAIVEEILANPRDVEELVVGLGNEDLFELDLTWLSSVASRFRGTIHLAVGNEPDREGVPGSTVAHAICQLREALPAAKLTVPFAYSIMERSHPVEMAEFTKEFSDSFKDVISMMDYFTINIYPFLSAGIKGVPLESLSDPSMPFLSAQLAALRVALGKMLPNASLPVAIGETGWPSCGAARFKPYSFATLDHSLAYLRSVAQWIESQDSDSAIIGGNVFTAFDEETKGTRPIEHHYGILAADGSVKTPYTCVTNATDRESEWLELDYPECENDLNWLVENFDDTRLMEKFAGRGIDGSLCSFQNYLYNRWASCPPVARVPGAKVYFDGVRAYADASAVTKCASKRLETKYMDRGATYGPPPGSHKPFRYSNDHRHAGGGDGGGFDSGSASSTTTSAPALVQAPLMGLQLAAEASPSRSLAKSAAQTLNVFWINLDASVDRREVMERRFEELQRSSPSGLAMQVTRVPAVTAEDVKAMVLNGTLSVAANLIEECTLACPLHHERGELLLSEVAVTLSHLRAVDLAYAAGGDYALILEDDIHTYRALAPDLAVLMEVAPQNWTALQMSTVSPKALLLLASTSDAFRPRESHFYGMGAYFIRRSGMEHLRGLYSSRHFARPLSGSASDMQAEHLIFGALPMSTVHACTRFYFNFVEFPTTIHHMAPNSTYYLVTNLRWQMNFLDLHRRRIDGGGKLRQLGLLRRGEAQVASSGLQSRQPQWQPPSQQQPQPQDHLQPGPSQPAGASWHPATDSSSRGSSSSHNSSQPTFLAMTTVVCKRSRPGFKGELKSIAASIRALEDMAINWTIFVVVEDEDEARSEHCPGFSKFSEFRQANVRTNYRAAQGRFSKWVYYAEDTSLFSEFDQLIVFDADMGLSTFDWKDFFARRESYTSRFGDVPVVGILREGTPFYPLRTEYWKDCGRSDIRFVESDFVEQWFAMLSGPFASWYLQRVVDSGLVMEQRSLGVDWGVDGAWCGAAAEWAGREAGCLLITMDMYHGDTKSLKQDLVFHQRGEHLNNLWWLRLPQWMKTSEIWLGSFFQDASWHCSPSGVEERYHIPLRIRQDVPIVPTGPPTGNGHTKDNNEDSGGVYAPKPAPHRHRGSPTPAPDAKKEEAPTPAPSFAQHGHHHAALLATASPLAWSLAAASAAPRE